MQFELNYNNRKIRAYRTLQNFWNKTQNAPAYNMR